MECPACGYVNIQGVDECENCGADLRTVDVPQPGDVLEAHLAGDQLEEVRSRPPLFVAPDAPLWVAIRTMQDARVTCLLVGDRARLDGILTERNLLMRAAGSPLDRVRVADIMTPEPVVLRGADTIATAIHTMAVGGFRHVPLVEAGRIVGIVTAGDLFRHILRIVA